ncbi:MAG: tRNA pseudouridine(55) synthase TruB [Acidobacteria bacterium]|jgi:tRNA pseudouridine55 synthase|nr:tRNA pseudouridine(55) synthase TruB [Acidobacteriota bacterium]
MTHSSPPCGLLLLDKPSGCTSHDIVRWVRGELGLRRVGHAGTLDPLATGLLPCLVGTATRLLQHLHGWSKSYVGVVVLGIESPTGDLEGLEGPLLRPAPTPPGAVLRAAEERLRGSYLQEPPAFSAKKIGGMRAHELARRGFQARLAPAPVTVHRLRLAPASEGRIRFAAEVSSGTYLRSLARDLGRLLGTGAYLEVLRRTGIGPLRVRAALRPPSDGGSPGLAERVIPLERVPLRLPTVGLDEAGLHRFCQGRPVPGPAGEATGAVRVLDASGRLAGIGAVDADGMLAPRTVLGRAASSPGGAEPGVWKLAPGDPGW